MNSNKESAPRNRTRIATVALAFGSIALSMFGATGTAAALNGNPAGETLEHCRSVESGPCVDTKGWGVRVKKADGGWTKNYGPESYDSWIAPDHKIFYRFTDDAKPYGKMRFPQGIDY